MIEKTLITKEDITEMYRDTRVYKEPAKSGDLIVQFDESSVWEEVRDNVHRYFEKTDDKLTGEKRLWALFGRIEDNKWICIEVGSSKDIGKEILDDIKLMFASEDDMKMNHSGALWKDKIVYTSPREKDFYKYKKVMELFDRFAWVEVTVEKWIDNKKLGEYDKTQFAEVNFAVNHKALLWNPAPSMNKNMEHKIFDMLMSKQEGCETQ